MVSPPCEPEPLHELRVVHRPVAPPAGQVRPEPGGSPSKSNLKFPWASTTPLPSPGAKMMLPSEVKVTAMVSVLPTSVDLFPQIEGVAMDVKVPSSRH